MVGNETNLTYQSFQIENSLRRTTWFTYDETNDENVPLPGLLNEHLLKILTDNSMVPRSRSDIYFKDVIVLVPALDYLQTLSVIKIPLNQFLKDDNELKYHDLICNVFAFLQHPE